MLVRSVLVTGANGFVGREVCRALLGGSLRVRGAVRRKGAIGDLQKGVIPVVIEPESTNDWDDAVRQADAVVHLIGMTHESAMGNAGKLDRFRDVNVGITGRVLAACGKSQSRFIYVSSVKAVGDGSPADSALVESDVYKPDDEYGRTKKEAEELIVAESRATALEYTIFRPPLVYGPRVDGNFLKLLKLIDRGVPLPFASVANQRSIIDVRNLSSAIVHSLFDKRAVGQTFHVADSQPISTPALIRALAQLMEKPARLFSVPEGVLTLGGSLAGRSADVRKLVGSLRLSTEHIASTIGWQAPYSTEAGLANTVAWYRNAM